MSTSRENDVGAAAASANDTPEIQQNALMENLREEVTNSVKAAVEENIRRSFDIIIAENAIKYKRLCQENQKLKSELKQQNNSKNRLKMEHKKFLGKLEEIFGVRASRKSVQERMIYLKKRIYSEHNKVNSCKRAMKTLRKRVKTVKAQNICLASIANNVTKNLEKIVANTNGNPVANVEPAARVPVNGNQQQRPSGVSRSRAQQNSGAPNRMNVNEAIPGTSASAMSANSARNESNGGSAPNQQLTQRLRRINGNFAGRNQGNWNID